MYLANFILLQTLQYPIQVKCLFSRAHFKATVPHCYVLTLTHVEEQYFLCLYLLIEIFLLTILSTVVAHIHELWNLVSIACGLGVAYRQLFICTYDIISSFKFAQMVDHMNAARLFGAFSF